MVRRGAPLDGNSRSSGGEVRSRQTAGGDADDRSARRVGWIDRRHLHGLRRRNRAWPVTARNRRAVPRRSGEQPARRAFAQDATSAARHRASNRPSRRRKDARLSPGNRPGISAEAIVGPPRLCGPKHRDLEAGRFEDVHDGRRRSDGSTSRGGCGSRKCAASREQGPPPPPHARDVADATKG